MRGIRAFTANHLSPYISMDCVEFLTTRKRMDSPRFRFNGHDLEYFFHSYNNFRLTERAVEIPVIGAYLADLQPGDILEIGNVSSHYYTFFRTLFDRPVDIVDRDERGFNVINCDIRNFRPGRTYDFIFSISTFEHMDEARDCGDLPSRDTGTCQARENLQGVVRDLLRPGGTMVLTVPAGQNPRLDQAILSGKLDTIPCRSIRIFLLRRIRELEWLQVPVSGQDLPEQPETCNDSDFRGVNSVFIIEIIAGAPLVPPAGSP